MTRCHAATFPRKRIVVAVAVAVPGRPRKGIVDSR
jgi:hypothetical protein